MSPVASGAAPIATLIPAYRPTFLGDVFASLQAQRFGGFRVLLSDGSPDGSITEALRGGRWREALRGIDLTVVRGPDGGWPNHWSVVDAWAGASPLVHVLMDDDVVYPDFYQAHVEAHAAARVPLSASVSLRWLLTAEGKPCGALPLPDFVREAATRVLVVDAPTLVRSTVVPCENWLGELSNMVFAREAVLRFPRTPADGVSYFGLPDMSMLLGAMDLGPVAVVREHLGGFRQHGGQTTVDSASTPIKIAHLAWVAFALAALDERRIDATQASRAIRIALGRCERIYANDPVIMPFVEAARGRLDEALPVFAERFAAAWGALLARNPDTAWALRA